MKKRVSFATAAMAVAMALTVCGGMAVVNTKPVIVEATSADENSQLISVKLEASEGVVAVNSPGMKGDEVTTTGAKVEISLSEKLTNVDYSNAVIKMVDGDGYYTNEFVNPVLSLDEKAWSAGNYVLEFDENAISTLFTRNVVSVDDTTGGPGWTQFGGNGNGQYFFNLAVSGIKNNGVPIPDATFRVCYYVYNRDGSDKARVTLRDYINVYDYEENESLVTKKTLSDWGITKRAGASPVWTWIDDATAQKNTSINCNVPVLCDTEQDDFYITWPTSVDASNIVASDVTIVLKGQYGDELVLEPNSDYYVYSSKGETQIAVPFVYMAFTPVYNTMEISVNPEAISGNTENANLKKSFDIASVYVYELQHGGLAKEGAVLCYQFYGFDENTVKTTAQLMNPFSYVLMRYDENGNKLYYANGTEVSDYNKATSYAADSELFGTRFWNQSILYNTKVDEILEDGTKVYGITSINGKDYYKVIPDGKDDNYGWDGSDSRGILMTATQAYANGLRPASGYAFANTDSFAEDFAQYGYGHDYWVPHSMWPWVEGIEVGWMNNPAEYKGGFENITKAAYGAYAYEGDGQYPNWSTPEANDVQNEEWWPWLRAKGQHSELFTALDRYIELNY